MLVGSRYRHNCRLLRGKLQGVVGDAPFFARVEKSNFLPPTYEVAWTRFRP